MYHLFSSDLDSPNVCRTLIPIFAVLAVLVMILQTGFWQLDVEGRHSSCWLQYVGQLVAGVGT
jgi:hypothetical protein